MTTVTASTPEYLWHHPHAKDDASHTSTPLAPTRPSSSTPAAGKPILQVPAKKPHLAAPSSGHTSSIQCHRYHGLGHMKRDCPSQRTYAATDAGYISALDVEDDDDTSDDARDDDAIDGDAATTNF
jgi:hypothetical protein